MAECFDILVAHPYKHHALNLAAGCIKSGLNVKMAFPLYRKGIGAILENIPGKIGRKAAGYFHSSLNAENVYSPLHWQIFKLYTLTGDVYRIQDPFDSCVAKKIDSGEWKFKCIVTLQDHMPKSMQAAKKKGYIVWSDQIINLSNSATDRISRHYSSVDMKSPSHNESVNDKILNFADIITVPSLYTLNGISDRSKDDAIFEVAPYGVDRKMFDVEARHTGGSIRILARANNIRKGGHLLLKALANNATKFIEAADGKKIEIKFLGKFDPVLISLIKTLNFPVGIQISDKEYAHSEVPELLKWASIFIMPTLSESMSLACAEAMQAGLPLITTSYAGMDNFSDESMGKIIDDTEESLAAGLYWMLVNRDKWDQMGKNARLSMQLSSWDSYENKISDIASNLLK